MQRGQRLRRRGFRKGSRLRRGETTSPRHTERNPAEASPTGCPSEPKGRSQRLGNQPRSAVQTGWEPEDPQPQRPEPLPGQAGRGWSSTEVGKLNPAKGKAEIGVLCPISETADHSQVAYLLFKQ